MALMRFDPFREIDGITEQVMAGSRATTSTPASLRLITTAAYLTFALRGAASGALPGVLIGWLFGLFSLPSRYEVVVDAEAADEAARLLASSPAESSRHARTASSG